jgi:hypothetical protein
VKRYYFSLTLSAIIFAYGLLLSAPTFAVENIFRGGINPDISNNFIIFKYKTFLKMDGQALLNEKVKSEAEKVSEDLSKEAGKEYFFELIFSLEHEGRIRVMQTMYKDSSMSEKSINGISFFPNFSSYLKMEENLSKSMFYSFIMMLVLNRSDSLTQILKKYEPEFKSSKDLMNEEKIKLLRKVKEYKKIVKEDPEQEEILISPLKPDDEEQRAHVTSLYKSNMYLPTPELKLARVDKQFFYKLSLNSIEAFFTNTDHFLKKFSLNLENKSYKLYLDDYRILNYSQYFPEHFLFQSSPYSFVQLKGLSLRWFNNKGDGLEKRFSKRHQRFLSKKKDGNSAVKLNDYISFIRL